jgi:hypothetical protein
MTTLSANPAAASFFRTIKAKALLILLIASWAVLASTLSGCQSYTPFDKLTPQQQQDFNKSLDEA